MATIGDVMLQAIRARDRARFEAALVQVEEKGGSPIGVTLKLLRRHRERCSPADVRWASEGVMLRGPVLGGLRPELGEG